MRIFFIVLSIYHFSTAQDFPPVLYIYPEPEAKYVSKDATIILRPGQKELHKINDPADVFWVTGDKQGYYEGRTFFSDNGKSIIFQPVKPFEPGEKVTVNLLLYDYNYHFYVSEYQLPQKDKRILNGSQTEFSSPVTMEKVETYGEVTTINGITVPSDFPVIDVGIHTGNTAPGNLFFGFRKSYFVITDNHGAPLFYEKSNDFLMDFKLQPGNLLSRTVDDWDLKKEYYVLMDQNFNYVDTIYAGHGYIANHHEFQLLPNGHSLMIVNDYQQIDMSQLVSGGKSDVTVTGNHLQELDGNNNVVFEWRSWDHYNIEDAIYENLTADYIDYVHMNAIAVDYDGHYLVSARNLSECTKINSNTGEIIWRLGGVNNQFTFINDDWGNWYQHFIRPVPDKENHYTLFDNGTHRSPGFSRAVEFKLDTTNWTAEKVWEYRHDPDYFAAWLGSVQRLDNGNTLICWGGGYLPFATEVTPDKEIVYEARSADQIYVYRTYRFDWMGKATKPNLIVENLSDRLILIFNKFGDEDVQYYKIYAGKSPDQLSLLDTSQTTFYEFSNPENNCEYYFKVSAIGGDGLESPFSEMRSTRVDYHEPEENMVRNGQFNQGFNDWQINLAGSADATVNTRDKFLKIDIQNPGSNWDDIQVKQDNIPLYKGRTYHIEFTASTTGSRILEVMAVKNSSPWTNYSRLNPVFIYDRTAVYEFEFTMEDETDVAADLVFNVGDDTASVMIDDINLYYESAVAIEENPRMVPVRYELEQNRPNPFNPVTIIPFRMHGSGSVTLTIFDINGRTVFEQFHPSLNPGKHEIRYNAAGISSGVYFYRLSVTAHGKRIETPVRKMMFLK